MKKVIVITGVTGSGKSEIAVDIAHKIDGEIINADSVSIYKHLDIGSAKIMKNEMNGIPHYLHDQLELSEKFDVATFQKQARDKIDEIHNKGKTPIIVGGSGLYINAVVYDYQFPEIELKPLPKGLSNEEMLEKLTEIDPETAAKIHVNNTKRLERALQVALTFGKKQKEINGNMKNKPVYDSVILFLSGERSYLYQRIDQRVDQMFEQGLVDEVKLLHTNDKRFFDYQSTNAIGYREFKEYFLGNRTTEEVKVLIKRNTRRFAKRQETWFRNQTDGIVININEDGYKNEVYDTIEEFLKRTN